MSTVPAVRLARVNPAVIEQEERAWVDEHMKNLPDAETRLRAASPLVDQAQQQFDELRPLRDLAGLSLSLHDGLRAVNTVMGITRTRFHEMRCDALQLTREERADKWLLNATKEQVAERARQVGLPHVTTAADQLPALAEQTTRAEKRAVAARQWRDDAVVALSDAGWPRPKIAEIMGKNPSRISHIKSARA